MKKTRRKTTSQSRGSHRNQPTHILKIRHNEYPGWIRVGVAWTRDSDDGFSIKLNKGVVLDWRDYTDDGQYVLMMFPNSDD